MWGCRCFSSVFCSLRTWRKPRRKWLYSSNAVKKKKKHNSLNVANNDQFLICEIIDCRWAAFVVVDLSLTTTEGRPIAIEWNSMNGKSVGHFQLPLRQNWMIFVEDNWMMTGGGKQRRNCCRLVSGRVTIDQFDERNLKKAPKSAVSQPPMRPIGLLLTPSCISSVLGPRLLFIAEPSSN